jgi:hypothetical protein
MMSAAHSLVKLSGIVVAQIQSLAEQFPAKANREDSNQLHGRFSKSSLRTPQILPKDLGRSEIAVKGGTGWLTTQCTANQSPHPIP